MKINNKKLASLLLILGVFAFTVSLAKSSIAANPSLTLDGIEITLPSSHKIQYTVGDDWNQENLEVKALYLDSDGNSVEPEVISITKENITGFDTSSASSSQTLIITFGGKTTSYEISVVAPADTTGPVLQTVTHDASAKTITLTWNEAVHFENDGFAPNNDIAIAPSIVNIFEATANGNGWDYDIGKYGSSTITSNATITNTVMSDGDKVLTVTYTGSLPVGNYVVDFWGFNGSSYDGSNDWGYNVVDASDNQDDDDADSIAFNVSTPVEIIAPVNTPSSSSGSRRQVLTFAPQGQVLGAETVNWNNLSDAEKAALIKALQAQLAEIIRIINELIANGTLK